MHFRPFMAACWNNTHGGFPHRHTDKHTSNLRERTPSQIVDECSILIVDRTDTWITVSYYALTSVENLERIGSWYKPACLFIMGSYCKLTDICVLFFSLCVSANMHIFMIKPPHFWCLGIFSIYVDQTVRVTTDTPHVLLRWKFRDNLWLFVICKTMSEKDCSSLLHVQ